MKEEHVQTAPDLKVGVGELLRKNLDLIALGLVVVLVLLEFAVGLLPRSAGDGNLEEELVSATAILDAREAARPADFEARGTRPAELAEDLRTAFRGATDAAPALEGLAAWPEAVIAAWKKGEPNALIFREPADLNGVAERGLNLIRWTVHTDHNVPLESFVILRRRGAADGEFVEVGRVDATTTSFEDKAIQAGHLYTYRVRGFAEEGAVAAEQRLGPLSEPVVLEGAADFRLTLLEADEEARTATFTVEKWHEGAFWPRRFTVAEGAGIGAPDAGSGVDYTTGRVLQKLAIEHLSSKRSLEEPVFGPDGRVLIEGGQVVREAVEVTEPYDRITVHLAGGGLPERQMSVEKRP